MELPGKVVLITGATGFVGRRTAQRFMLEGMHVRGLVRRPVALPDLENYLGDIMDTATVAPAAAGAHVVVHCAAVLPRVMREEAMQVNVEGTRIVLKAVLQAGCERFIHLSTVSAYAVEGYDLVDEATPSKRRWPRPRDTCASAVLLRGNGTHSGGQTERSLGGNTVASCVY